jgi:hypothetical protein
LGLKLKNHPYFTQSGSDRESDGDQYVANICGGSVSGFKYFDIEAAKSITVEASGNGKGEFIVSNSPDFEPIAACVKLVIHGRKNVFAQGACSMPSGKQAIFFKYCGSGSINFVSFELCE